MGDCKGFPECHRYCVCIEERGELTPAWAFRSMAMVSAPAVRCKATPWCSFSTGHKGKCIEQDHPPGAVPFGGAS